MFNQHPAQLSRRTFLATATGTIVVGLGTNLLPNQAIASTLTSEKTTISANQALQLLIEGNQRYVLQTAHHPHQDGNCLLETATAQNPFAVILSCSDSRVPPELVFDRGLGNLFVVRVAGNIIDDAVLGSIEYAVEYLNVPLVMVLGHERCGAVTAALVGGKAPAHISK